MMMGVNSACFVACAAACIELIELPPIYATCLTGCYAIYCGDPPVDLLEADKPILLTDKDFDEDCSCTSASALREAIPLLGNK